MSKKLENKVIEGKTQNKGGVIQKPYCLRCKSTKFVSKSPFGRLCAKCWKQLKGE